MKILTISIAAYNIERFIKQTLDSLNDERLLDDIEVLIIDDGSKDNTATIAQKYSDMCPNTFRVIRKENGGYGSTVNRGIAEATGKYFRLLDGDDYVNTDNLVKFIERLKKSDSDMVICDYRCVDNDGNRSVDPYIIRNGVNCIQSLDDNRVYDMESGEVDAFAIAIHTLAIKTDLLKEHGVHITEHCYYVDIEFVAWCIAVADTLMYVDIPVYMYRKDQLNNSVNKASMVKNIAMQETVVYSLFNMYKTFSLDGIGKGRMALIRARITGSVGAAIRTYLLMDNSRERTVGFVNKLKSVYPTLWDEISDDRFISYVTVCNYILLPLIKIAYKIYLKLR